MKAFDHWAVPGQEYSCGSKCGYRFRVTGSPHDRQWSVQTERSGGYRTLGPWEAVEDQYGDCSGHLLRHYGPTTSHSDEEDQDDELDLWTLMPMLMIGLAAVAAYALRLPRATATPEDPR